ncbi:hypothetical protein Efla_002510 [Eimeria flavescens]
MTAKPFCLCRDVNWESQAGLTCYHLAAAAASPTFASFLLHRGAYTNRFSGYEQKTLEHVLQKALHNNETKIDMPPAHHMQERIAALDEAQSSDDSKWSASSIIDRDVAAFKVYKGHMSVQSLPSDADNGLQTQLADPAEASSYPPGSEAASSTLSVGAKMLAVDNSGTGSITMSA